MSLKTQLDNVFTRIGTEFKTVYGRMGALASLTTTNKTTLVAAINEVQAATAQAGAQINDSLAGTGTVYSSSKTDSQIAAATAALVNSAPAALDTLAELSAALGGDANFATTVSNALGNRLRFDAVQTLTAGQKTQGLSNLGAAPETHSHTAAQISDATATGRSVLTAASQAAARTAIGAGTSSLALGTTAGTAKAGDYAPPNATEAAPGLIEIASPTEGTTGTDNTRAMTPALVKAGLDTKAPITHNHTASQISDASATGTSLLTAASAAAARGVIGAGTSSLVIGTTPGTAADAAEVGDTNANFVAVFEAALV